MRISLTATWHEIHYVNSHVWLWINHDFSTHLQFNEAITCCPPRAISAITPCSDCAAPDSTLTASPCVGWLEDSMTSRHRGWENDMGWWWTSGGMANSSIQWAHGRLLAQQTCWNVAAATGGSPYHFPSPTCSTRYHSLGFQHTRS